MLEIGRWNNLKVVKLTERGLYLDGGQDGEILLPKREVTTEMKVDDILKTFIYFDSEDRLIATLESPFAQVGDFAHLRVKSLERVGAFLDWGLSKDLFLPYAEQTRDLKVGQNVIVFLYLDKSDRISASMRVDRHLNKTPSTFKEGETVDLFVYAKTDLGFKAVVNGTHTGMLFHNEVFTNLDFGTRTKGYIKTIRADGKIDLRLHQEGHKGSDDIGEKILSSLRARGGFLPLTEKTPPEKIYEMFGVSKKKYKMALGGLYKKRMIVIEDDGIRLA